MSDRMSPRFIAREAGITTREVYDKLIEEGLLSNRDSAYAITELGKAMSGRPSLSGGAPTFLFSEIEKFFE